uniref:SUI1 domain-containing protein n=1 Tax=Craspedostauros australis TaxID=1486917 RepID=A0A7R9WU55_9STRA|mmetsp:Transcript_21075/g.58628  ORF Transcript_21075/g.58628 Transcript_21075/m.58628 type:complete len:269 (+) Transcript_21075:293-1099(+)|eukprot:CAMPEP_0198130370 /NCGR_PEP_ID=MMETSP1442-20131203/53793_1 /TAXON_ID= /ORGANISM="Craspedostauros australis, Strain CCMP3328" /LENGTH=268 /DNA_ID=CAMNT_0043790969 /DNA_START=273 /DNA_END=1079 /DNA_ORIENTATION=+
MGAAPSTRASTNTRIFSCCHELRFSFCCLLVLALRYANTANVATIGTSGSTTVHAFAIPTTRIGSADRAAGQSPFTVLRNAVSEDANGDGASDALEPKKKKKKKKPAFVINTNLVGTISSNPDGDQNKPRSTGSLGVKSKKFKSERQQKQRQKMSSSLPTDRPLTKKEKQRTGNGQIDSSKQTLLSDAETKANEPVQVLEAKRGNKVVTIIRGMTSPMDDRKALLKEFKKKIGGGGAFVDGVLELQGAHAEKTVTMLRSKGYDKAKKI